MKIRERSKHFHFRIFREGGRDCPIRVGGGGGWGGWGGGGGGGGGGGLPY